MDNAHIVQVWFMDATNTYQAYVGESKFADWTTDIIKIPNPAGFKPVDENCYLTLVNSEITDIAYEHGLMAIFTEQQAEEVKKFIEAEFKKPELASKYKLDSCHIRPDAYRGDGRLMLHVYICDAIDEYLTKDPNNPLSKGVYTREDLNDFKIFKAAFANAYKYMKKNYKEFDAKWLCNVLMNEIYGLFKQGKLDLTLDRILGKAE